MRIELTDDVQTVLFKMSDGNPGAITVLIELLTTSDSIDPDNILGGFGAILTLDSKEIYGDKIWILYKDVCDESLTNMIALIRAEQLGLTSQTLIAEHMYAHPYRGKKYEYFDILIPMIRQTLPNFANGSR